MKPKTKKVYFENDFWRVYLNSHNKIKVDDMQGDKTLDYHNQISDKQTDIPKEVLDKCKELQRLWLDGSIYDWLDNWHKLNKKKKSVRLK